MDNEHLLLLALFLSDQSPVALTNQRVQPVQQLVQKKRKTVTAEASLSTTTTTKPRTKMDDEHPEPSLADPIWLIALRENISMSNDAMLRGETLFALIVGGFLSDQVRESRAPLHLAMMVIVGLVLCGLANFCVVISMKVHTDNNYHKRVLFAGKVILTFIRLVVGTLLVILFTVIFKLMITGGNTETSLTVYFISFCLLGMGIVLVQCSLAWLLGFLSESKVHDILVNIFKGNDNSEKTM